MNTALAWPPRNGRGPVSEGPSLNTNHSDLAAAPFNQNQFSSEFATPYIGDVNAGLSSTQKHFILYQLMISGNTAGVMGNIYIPLDPKEKQRKLDQQRERFRLFMQAWLSAMVITGAKIIALQVAADHTLAGLHTELGSLLASNSMNSQHKAIHIRDEINEITRYRDEVLNNAEQRLYANASKPDLNAVDDINKYIDTNAPKSSRFQKTLDAVTASKRTMSNIYEDVSARVKHNIPEDLDHNVSDQENTARSEQTGGLRMAFGTSTSSESIQNKKKFIEAIKQAAANDGAISPEELNND